jgi:hypothetical protein
MDALEIFSISATFSFPAPPLENRGEFAEDALRKTLREEPFLEVRCQIDRLLVHIATDSATAKR